MKFNVGEVTRLRVSTHDEMCRHQTFAIECATCTRDRRIDELRAERDELRRLLTFANDGRAQLEGWRDALERERDELREALRAVCSTWASQAGRVYESMGDDNPRVAAIDAAIENAATILSRHPAQPVKGTP